MTTYVIPKETFQVDRLQVNLYNDRQLLGRAAGLAVAAKMRELQEHQDTIRMLFGAAPSANEFLATLRGEEGLRWDKVVAFHMDEYIGLPANAPETFGKFLRDGLFDHVKPGVVHFIDSSKPPEEECKRYGSLIAEAVFDIVCLGMGENGHIAFNDPPVADFNDPEVVKIVELDSVCRQQQVNDKCFPDLTSVPTHAITITIPPMTSGKYLYSVVPGPTKTKAVKQALNGPISTECPASIIRTHANCTLYVDVLSCPPENRP